MTLIFALLGGLLVLAVVANRLFSRTRIPDAVVLMIVGLLLGPAFGLLDLSGFQPVIHAFGTLAVILILFEAGLDLDLRDTLRHFPGGLFLAFLAYAIGVGLVAFVVANSMNLSVGNSMLIGAVLACTSSSITVPILQQMEIEKPAKITMLLEASMSDAFAVLTVGILLDLGESPGRIFPSIFYLMFFDIVVSLALAFLAAMVWSFVLPRLSSQRFWQVLTFAIVLLLYAGVQRIGANGLIAVLGFGLAMANIRRVDPHLIELSTGMELVGEERHFQMLNFHSELAFLVRSFFFVLIGITVSFTRMIHVLPAILGIVGALMAARWLALLGSRWLLRNFRPLELETVFWIMPRGLITVVLALQVVTMHENDLAFLPSLAFGAILATNILVVIGTIRARRLAPQLPPSVPANGESPTQPE